jgi:hypothetical protein
MVMLCFVQITKITIGGVYLIPALSFCALPDSSDISIGFSPNIPAVGGFQIVAYLMSYGQKRGRYVAFSTDILSLREIIAR